MYCTWISFLVSLVRRWMGCTFPGTSQGPGAATLAGILEATCQGSEPGKRHIQKWNHWFRVSRVSIRWEAKPGVAGTGLGRQCWAASCCLPKSPLSGWVASYAIWPVDVKNRIAKWVTWTWGQIITWVKQDQVPAPFCPVLSMGVPACLPAST